MFVTKSDNKHFFFLFSLLRIKPRTWNLLHKYFTTYLQCQSFKERSSYIVTKAGQEWTIQSRLASDLGSSCLYSSIPEITVVCHLAWQELCFWLWKACSYFMDLPVLTYQWWITLTYRIRMFRNLVENIKNWANTKGYDILRTSVLDFFLVQLTEIK